MEKLIELLNEYEECWKEKNWMLWCRWENLTGMPVARSEYDDEIIDNSDLLLTSRKHGFIKWLVDNDKIDRKKAHEKIKELGKDYWWFDIYSWIVENCLLMLLAISDSPIDFLCEIIKN